MAKAIERKDIVSQVYKEFSELLNLIQMGVKHRTNPWATSGLESSCLEDRKVTRSLISVLCAAQKCHGLTQHTWEGPAGITVAVATPCGWCQVVGKRGSFRARSKYRFHPHYPKVEHSHETFKLKWHIAKKKQFPVMYMGKILCVLRPKNNLS